MTKIEISDENVAKPEYDSASEESGQIRADKPDKARGVWYKVRSKRIQQLVGVGFVLGLIFWAAYIVVSIKQIDSVDVIAFEITITLIICFALAVHLRRTSIR